MFLKISVYIIVYIYFFIQNAYGRFFNSFNSSSCISAFLLFRGLTALILGSASLWARTFVFLHDVDSKACLTAILCCYDFVRLWLWSWGPVVMLESHSLPPYLPGMQYFISPCFFGLIVLSGSRSPSPSVFLQLYSLQWVAGGFGFVLSWFHEASPGVLGS